MNTRVRGFRWKNIVCALLVVIVVTGSAPLPAFAQTSFTFISRGFGHGVGMSQFGARGFAEAGYGHVHILRHYYGSGGTDPRTAVSTVLPEPFRDVNLDGDADYDSGNAGFNAGFTRSLWTLRPGHAGSQLAVRQDASGVTETFPDGWSTFEASGSSIIFRAPGGQTRTFTRPVAVWGATGDPRLTQVSEATGQYDRRFVRFRGELYLTASAGRIKLINRVSMPEYLYGVVPREMPASWHMEALKAQAIAARSYSWTLGTRELYSTTEDQVYGGHSRGDPNHSNGEDRTRTIAHEHSRSNSAVDVTWGRVVTHTSSTHPNDIVRTFYMSTSGGHTENSENVWRTAYPHLRGVPDPYEVNARADRHSWTQQTFTAAQVRDRLLAAGATASEVPTPLVSIRVTARGVSGRPTRVEFRSPTATGVFDTPAEVRRFRRNDLLRYSHWFYVNPRTERIAGPDRFATAVAASTRVFTPQAGSNPARAAIIVNGHAVADMLAASSLAGAVGGAPVLMVSPEGVPASTAAEIRRLGVPAVIIVGGTGVVSDSVKAELGRISGVAVRRFGGADRFATAAAVALEVDRLVPASRMIAVNGESMVDGIAAAGLAYAKDLPIVLVRRDSIPPVSADALRQIAPGETLVIGGAAVIGDQVMPTLPGARRIAAGANRFETATLLSRYLVASEGFNTGNVYVASGDTLVDALALGPLTGHNRNPLLFVQSYSFPGSTSAEIDARAAGIQRVFIVGGERALSGWVQGQVEQALE